MSEFMIRNKVLILVAVTIIAIATLTLISSTKPESNTIPSTPQAVQSTDKTNQNPSTVIPSIALSSEKASAGNMIQVSGQGFVQSAPVKITLPDNSVVNLTTSPGTYSSTLGMSGKYGTDNAHFGYPESVALDSSGNIYVADRGNDRVQKFSSSGKYIFTLGVSGKSDTDNSHFNTPVSVTLDSSGNIYVADTYNHRIQKFSSSGTYLSTLGVSGEYGTDNAHFSYPASVALDSYGDIYVADFDNNRVQKFMPTGSFEKYVTIPSAAPGTYVISATDGKNSASSTFSLVSHEMSANEPVQISTGAVNASNTPAFYLLSHGISVKDAIQKSTGPVNASNTFAFFLLSNIAQKDKGNIFFSPYSISDAFSMAYEGARGQTESEIQSVFGFADRQTQRESVRELDSKINSPNANYTLNIANALWVQKDFTILKEYSESLQKYYSAKAENLDFVNNAEESRGVINKWVEDKTAQKIKDLLPPGSLDGSTRVVLTDAVYFKGTWFTKFDESETRDANFSVSENNTVKVPMMHVETGFKYLEDDDLKILDMPYNGGKLSMMIILPKDKNSDKLISLVSSDKLNQWKKNLAVKEVSVHMPKFMLHTTYELNENLAEMGMPSAFDPAVADFSGITGYKDLYIDGVYHKAFVDVNEKGTEAAAATAIAMAVMGENAGVQPLEFNADHPFIFLIYDNQTGLVLFAGQVVDPSEK